MKSVCVEGEFSELYPVFVSGWATPVTVWQDVIKFLPQNMDYGLLSWQELLQNGETSILANRFPNKKLLLCGWSLGGVQLLQEVFLGLEAVAGLVLLAGTARMVADEQVGYGGANAREIRTMQVRLRRMPKDVLRDFATVCFAPFATDVLQEKFVTDATDISSKDLKNGLQYLLKADLRENLSKVKIPTLILHGDSDGIIPSCCSQFLHKHLPNSLLHIIKGAGHGLIITHAQQVAKQIGRFCNVDAS